MTPDTSLQPWSVDHSEFPADADAAARLGFLVRYAVLAPSGHNTQPWAFRIDGDAVELRADRRQRLPVVDPADRALSISCGAALLNLRVAARRFDLRDDACTPHPDPGDRDLLARFRLVAGDPHGPAEEALFEAIPRRRTTRAAYRDQAVPQVMRDALGEAAEREGAWLHIVTDAQRGEVADLVAEGDRHQMADGDFRRELAAWIHPNTGGARRGMRGYGLGLGDLMSHVGPLVIRTFDIGSSQAAKDRELADHAPVLAVLGTASDTPDAWLRAGQAMQRTLLCACAHGLTSSFLNQPIEVDALRPRLAEAIGCGRDHPQLLMRFGHGPEVPHSPRVPAEEVIIRS